MHFGMVVRAEEASEFYRARCREAWLRYVNISTSRFRRIWYFRERRKLKTLLNEIRKAWAQVEDMPKDKYVIIRRFE